MAGSKIRNRVYQDQLVEKLAAMRRDGKPNKAIERDLDISETTRKRFTKLAAARGLLPKVKPSPGEAQTLEAYLAYREIRKGAIGNLLLELPTEVRDWLIRRTEPGDTLADALKQVVLENYENREVK